MIARLLTFGFPLMRGIGEKTADHDDAQLAAKIAELMRKHQAGL